MWGRMRFVAVAVALGAGAFPAVAGAIETTATFDDLAAGTTVSNQYAGRGITFGPFVAGQAQATRALPVVASVGSTQAASGDRVGRVQRTCFSVDCVGTPETWASFSSGQARVRVSVGAFGTVSTTLTLTAFNASGVQVGQDQKTVTGGQGFRTLLSVSVTSATIRFVRIRGSGLSTFGVDSLFISDQPSTGPDFSISVPFGPHVVQQGRSITVPVTLTRRNSSGTIRTSASGLPSQTTSTPVDHTLISASPLASTHTINLPITASASAPPSSGATVTVTAAPLTKEAGLDTRSLTIQVRVLVLYDLRITGVEPTQGIQLPAFASTTSATSSRYSGVGLQYLGRTIVRVYANTPLGAFPVSGVGARLHGFDASGAPLPGSPLFADQGTEVVPFGTNPRPTHTERTNAAAGFTFTLPLSWAGLLGATSQSLFRTSLRAELILPTQGISFRECDFCSANNVHTLTELSYTPTCCVTVASAIITARGGTTPRSVAEIMAPGLPLFPLQIDLKPYGTTLDLTDALETNAKGLTVINRDQAIAKLLDFNQRDGGEAVLGILSPEFSDGFGAVPYGIFDDLTDRPLTSSAHELAHALGRPHASKSCNANDSGEPWPPDETGLIGGYAVDRRVASPYRAFATPPELDVQPSPLPTTESGGDPRAFYDLLSYCAAAGGGDLNSWISVKGWNDTLRRWAGGRDNVAAAAAATAPAPRARAAQAGPGRLQVNAAVAATGVRILSVRPLIAKPEAGLSPTPYRLVVRNAGGAVIADVAMSGRTFVVDRGGPPPTVVQGSAPVDLAAARTVEIVRDGVVLARRARSANAPTARFLSPKRGTLVGRGEKLAIRWQAGDADRDRLETTVEWSPRGGRPGTWRSVFLGPNGGRIALPSDYFAGSDDAFLRLRVSDGFNETVVVSPPFRTIHRRPTVRILTPRRGASVRRDATLLLSARAVDERRTLIGSRSIRWFIGRREVARGNGVGVRGLRPGTRTLRAEATDARGRRGAATVRLRVQAVAPTITRLDAPRRITPRTRTVRLRVATSLPARLVVRGGRRVVRTRTTSRSRTVTVRVLRSGGVLRLRLALTTDGKTRRTVVEIDR